jgi:hypothetical protein
VGFWGPYDGYPDPRSLVRPGWESENRDRIAAYLSAGHVVGYCMDYAFCRFRDCSERLGTADMTDGEWIWPEKLEHYVLHHSVCLPEKLIASMRANGWKMPAVAGVQANRRATASIQEHFADTAAVAALLSTERDSSEWVEWARQATT